MLVAEWIAILMGLMRNELDVSFELNVRFERRRDTGGREPCRAGSGQEGRIMGRKMSQTRTPKEG